jgi:hypothetical protein
LHPQRNQGKLSMWSRFAMQPNTSGHLPLHGYSIPRGWTHFEVRLQAAGIAGVLCIQGAGDASVLGGMSGIGRGGACGLMLDAERASVRGKAAEALFVWHPMSADVGLLLHVMVQSTHVLIAALAIAQPQQRP